MKKATSYAPGAGAASSSSSSSASTSGGAKPSPARPASRPKTHSGKEHKLYKKNLVMKKFRAALVKVNTFKKMSAMKKDGKNTNTTKTGANKRNPSQASSVKLTKPMKKMMKMNQMKKRTIPVRKPVAAPAMKKMMAAMKKKIGHVVKPRFKKGGLIKANFDSMSVPYLTATNQGKFKQGFHFVQLADTQLGMSENLGPKQLSVAERHELELEMIRSAVKTINHLKPAFVVLCGDMTDEFPGVVSQNQVEAEKKQNGDQSKSSGKRTSTGGGKNNSSSPKKNATTGEDSTGTAAATAATKPGNKRTSSSKTKMVHFRMPLASPKPFVTGSRIVTTVGNNNTLNSSSNSSAGKTAVATKVASAGNSSSSSSSTFKGTAGPSSSSSAALISSGASSPKKTDNRLSSTPMKRSSTSAVLLDEVPKDQAEDEQPPSAKKQLLIKSPEGKKSASDKTSKQPAVPQSPSILKVRESKQEIDEQAKRLAADAKRRAQIAELQELLDEIDPEIPLLCCCGNHDVGNRPNGFTLEEYRVNWGADYFSFWMGGVYCMVLNSQLVTAEAAEEVEKEVQRQDEWFEGEIEERLEKPAKAVIAFSHISPFIKTPKEPSAYFNWNKNVRLHTLERLHSCGCKAWFGGHYHRNSVGNYKGMQVVTTGAVGVNIETDPKGDPLGLSGVGKGILDKKTSGLRIVKVTDEGEVKHQWRTFEELDKVVGSGKKESGEPVDVDDLLCEQC
ncbi:unnamed protein product [Amoebophrya sp. A120]|nr:unnamed protein product [Amoebophrya sp. A120]|eukprot:GSA120T00011216001.1